ncbi:unnamed protein product [Cuscuta campestris]|uniref:Uncharacterized protein n=1 Tax=Cuscuta campestris TaxID=132261 RepID=A0A484M6U8_9ASTE|nr:unnamed protein product [Cuscuta campestris]
MYEVDQFTALKASMKSIVKQTIKEHLGASHPRPNQYTEPVNQAEPYGSGSHHQSDLVLSCEHCFQNHLSSACPLIEPPPPSRTKEVNLAQYANKGEGPWAQNNQEHWRERNSFPRNNRPRDDYKQGNWNNNKTNYKNTNAPYVPPHNRQPPQEDSLARMEKMMMEYMQKMNNLAEDMKERDKTRDSQLQQVFKQLGVREQGNLPATTEPNPREQLRAITFRSGKELQGPEVEVNIGEVPVDTPIGTTPQKKTESTPQGAGKEETSSSQTLPTKQAQLNTIPFPTRVKKNKDEKAFQKFLGVIGQVEVKMPLVDVLTEMPKYGKFLKDLVTKKRDWEEFPVVSLNAECSAMLLEEMLRKRKDPGCFIIPCSINDRTFGDALADLGASINLMPSSIMKALGLTGLKPTQMCLQLADSSIRYPRGVIEDVLVKEFDLQIKDRKGSANQAVDHLSRLDVEVAEQFGNCIVNESFPFERIYVIQEKEPWYADIANFLEGKIEPTLLTPHLSKKLKREAHFYFWDDPYLFRICADQVVRRCVTEAEGREILAACHSGPVVIEFGMGIWTTRLDSNRLVDTSQEQGQQERPEYPTATRADVHLVGSGPIQRFEMWGRHRSLTESVYLSSAVLADYGYAKEMEQLLQGTRWHRLFMMRAESSLPLTIEFLCSLELEPSTGSRWHRLFMMRAESSLPLTIEFLCSLELEPSTGSRSMNFQSIDSRTTLTFTLLGRGFQLTVADLATHLGLYSWEETSAPEFEAAPYLLPADIDPADFWAEHSSDPDRFEGMGRARFWIQPTWRILSFVLSTSFFGRPLNTDRVYPDDLIVFRSLHTRREVNMAVFVARFLYSQSMGNRTHIVCGFVVTILFRSLEGSAPIPRAQMMMRDLDAGMLRNAHIRRRLGAGSTESNAASSSAPSTLGASSQVSSRRATRRRPTPQATPATTQADPTPEWARRILEQQDTILQRMSEIGQQQASQAENFAQLRRTFTSFYSNVHIGLTPRSREGDDPSTSVPPPS